MLVNDKNPKNKTIDIKCINISKCLTMPVTSEKFCRIFLEIHILLKKNDHF